MLLMIDNYDSFTFNLVQYLAELGAKVKVVRNDQVTIDEIESCNPEWVVISPGPCSPKEAGVSVEVIKHFSGRVPLLGVCLGHQCIAHAYGGVVTYAKTLMHGKTSPVTHDSLGVFTDIPSPFTATRYHSLAVDALKLPNCLEVTATTDDGEIMGIRHKDFPVQGVQFHPESILSEHGHQLLKNFLDQR